MRNVIDFFDKKYTLKISNCNFQPDQSVWVDKCHEYWVHLVVLYLKTNLNKLVSKISDKLINIIKFIKNAIIKNYCYSTIFTGFLYK